LDPIISASTKDFLLLGGTVLSSSFGLAVWLVKQHDARLRELSDRYFAHLESQLARSDSLISQQAELVARIDDLIELIKGDRCRYTETRNESPPAHRRSSR